MDIKLVGVGDSRAGPLDDVAVIGDCLKRCENRVSNHTVVTLKLDSDDLGVSFILIDPEVKPIEFDK